MTILRTDLVAAVRVVVAAVRVVVATIRVMVATVGVVVTTVGVVGSGDRGSASGHAESERQSEEAAAQGLHRRSFGLSGCPGAVASEDWYSLKT